MFLNYLVAAWRNARRDLGYAVLNVLGLALGFSVVILIWLFVLDELSYNSFLPGYRDVYVMKLTVAEAGQRPVTMEGTPERMAAELKLDFPEIASVTRTRTQSVGLRHGTVEAVENITWADPSFFSVLGYALLRGDPALALAQPDSVVLTRSLALKYFGTLDCLGRTSRGGPRSSSPDYGCRRRSADKLHAAVFGPAVRQDRLGQASHRRRHAAGAGPVKLGGRDLCPAAARYHTRHDHGTLPGIYPNALSRSRRARRTV